MSPNALIYDNPHNSTTTQHVVLATQGFKVFASSRSFTPSITIQASRFSEMGGCEAMMESGCLDNMSMPIEVDIGNSNLANAKTSLVPLKPHIWSQIDNLDFQFTYDFSAYCYCVAAAAMVVMNIISGRLSSWNQQMRLGKSQGHDVTVSRQAVHAVFAGFLMFNYLVTHAGD